MAPNLADTRSRAARALTWPARFWAVGLVIGGWQLWISVGEVDPIVMPAPTSVARYVISSPSTYLFQGAITTQVAVSGLVIGMIAGLLLAVVACLVPSIGALIEPAVLVIPTVPIVVIIPVVASVVGFNRWTVIVVAVLLSFFPVFVLSTSGLRYRPASRRRLLSPRRGSSQAASLSSSTIGRAQSTDRGFASLPLPVSSALSSPNGSLEPAGSVSSFVRAVHSSNLSGRGERSSSLSQCP
jgi:hypothetical protein